MRSFLLLILILVAGQARAQSADVHFVDLRELWEVGADEDEEVIFGVISSVAADEEGNVYVLDRQLTEVSMFSAGGEYLGPVGREGEGPGEYTRIGDVFVSRPGELGVVQRMPGRIVSVRTDGTPGTEIPVPEGFRSAPSYFYGADRAGDGLVVSARQMARMENGVRMTIAVVLIGADGHEIARFAERSQVRDPSTMEPHERDEAETVWAVDDEGYLYVSEDFDLYEVKVYAPTGQLVRTIRRDYEHRQRTEHEKDINTPRMQLRMRGGGGGRNIVGIPSETDRDVQAIYPRPDGSVWVLGSHGAFDVPEGVLVTVDVFDADGRYVRQLALRGEGDYRDDGVHVIGDRIFVTRGFQAALRAERGLAGEEEDFDAEQMSVVCFEFASDVGSVAGGR